MLKNNKGFSIVELLAMILITTIIIYPLMQSLVKNVEINERLLSRQNATTIASTTLYGMSKISYDNIISKVELENNNGNYFLEINADNCNDLFPSTDPDQAADGVICSDIFDIVVNNFTVTGAEFKVYIYNYLLSDDYYNELTDVNNNAIEDQVQVEIGKLKNLDDQDNDYVVPNLGYSPPSSLLRITVWIQYYNEPPYYVVLSGLIVNETNKSY